MQAKSHDLLDTLLLSSSSDGGGLSHREIRDEVFIDIYLHPGNKKLARYSIPLIFNTPEHMIPELLLKNNYLLKIYVTLTFFTLNLFDFQQIQIKKIQSL